MISKELLSEVLGVDIAYFQVRQNEVIYTYDDIDDSINIYELAHKVKEWALDSGVMIGSDSEGCAIIGIRDGAIIVIKSEFWADTGPEATFKAGQWILENKND